METWRVESRRRQHAVELLRRVRSTIGAGTLGYIMGHDMQPAAEATINALQDDLNAFLAQEPRKEPT
jgi:hypothetical protein